MRVREMFQKEFLAAEDLESGDVTLTIHSVAAEDMRNAKGGTETQFVVQFQEMVDRNAKDSTKLNKRLVLNVTNANTIAKVVGSTEADDWPGSKITLFATTTKWAGKTVPCIRVRA